MQQVYKDSKLPVVSGASPWLMGRNWLRTVRLDWVGCRHLLCWLVSRTNLQRCRTNTRRILGLSHRSAQLTVKPNAQHKLFKPWPVPFALKEHVEKELTRLEQEGVIQKTHFSEWFASVIVMPKLDSRCRIWINVHYLDLTTFS